MSHRRLSLEEKELMRSEIEWERPKGLCKDCGGYHMRIACPRIKRVVLVGQGAGAGNRIEVEYWEKWDDSDVIYPEDVWDEEEAEAPQAP